jgi:hypothetical protein
MAALAIEGNTIGIFETSFLKKGLSGWICTS